MPRASSPRMTATPQSSALTAIKIVFGLVPAAAALLAMIVFITYPLTDQRFREVDPGQHRLVELHQSCAGGQQTSDLFAQHPHDIACFIAEPIQGEGGDNHMRAEFLQAMHRLFPGTDVASAGSRLVLQMRHRRFPPRRTVKHFRETGAISKCS